MRKYAFQNLIIGLTNYNFINDGLKSGYPICCIFYYFIRGIYRNIKDIIFNELSPATDRYSEEQHIICPIHLIIYKNQKKKLKYYTCKKCNWHQFEIKNCNKCPRV